MTIHYWQQLSTTDFAQLDKTRTLVLLPFGATEQHGPHLPVGTDALLVEEVLRRLAYQKWRTPCLCWFARSPARDIDGGGA
jgi:creatinine amidohydrolase/Fe(II)-dependent formamide hydrolase-like protein